NRILYFHTDVNGAPEEMTDSDGKIVWETGYQVWGNTIQEKDHGRVEQNLRYQGQYLDRETGLHYNLHRYYDPDVGRFIVTDPIGLNGGINLYAYAPNPLSWIDPLGLKSCGPARTKHVPNRHIRRHNNIGNSKFSLKERIKLRSKSKYRKPSQYRKLEDRTMRDPSRVLHQSDGRIRYERDYDRVIGTRGEKGHVTIYDPAKGKVITSYPAHL
ncbi:RHS repeat-associated core domain-containing protein, partial [Escherichia marmotae]|nr:RHS repeat-associated core domain-containing protein [Escherichia marmotae]